MHTMLADALRTTDATYRESIEKLREALNAADAVIVGAGAGLSTAAGYAYGGERFHAHFADFEERFGIRDMYSGGFFPFPTRQEFWAFWSRMIWLNRYTDDPKPTYQKLRQLLEGRDYFVITTNVDHRFQAAGFEKERLFYTQGDYGLFQCSKPCCQETFDNEKAVRAMLEQQEGMRVPEGLLPMCPHCRLFPTCAVTIRSWRTRDGIQRPTAIIGSCASIGKVACSIWSWAWATTRRSSSSIRSGA